jgi:hypothetical protein
VSRSNSRNYSTARRNELAEQRGFRSYGEQRRYSANIQNRSALEKLPASAREVRQAALDVKAEALRTGADIAELAAREGITVDAVRWWTVGAVRRKGGKLTVAAGDRLFRPMYVYSAGRVEQVDVRGSKVASQIGGYHSAIQHYLNTGDSSRLARFRGVMVAGVELETDLDVIDELARRGGFTFESIYRMVDR